MGDDDLVREIDGAREGELGGAGESHVLTVFRGEHAHLKRAAGNIHPPLVGRA